MTHSYLTIATTTMIVVMLSCTKHNVNNTSTIWCIYSGL